MTTCPKLQVKVHKSTPCYDLVLSSLSTLSTLVNSETSLSTDLGLEDVYRCVLRALPNGKAGEVTALDLGAEYTVYGVCSLRCGSTQFPPFALPSSAALIGCCSLDDPKNTTGGKGHLQRNNVQQVSKMTAVVNAPDSNDLMKPFYPLRSFYEPLLDGRRQCCSSVKGGGASVFVCLSISALARPETKTRSGDGGLVTAPQERGGHASGSESTDFLSSALLGVTDTNIRKRLRLASVVRDVFDGASPSKHGFLFENSTAEKGFEFYLARCSRMSVAERDWLISALVDKNLTGILLSSNGEEKVCPTTISGAAYQAMVKCLESACTL